MMNDNEKKERDIVDYSQGSGQKKAKNLQWQTKYSGLSIKPPFHLE